MPLSRLYWLLRYIFRSNPKPEELPLAWIATLGVRKTLHRNLREKSYIFCYKLLFEGSEEERLHELGLDPNIPISNWGWYYPESNYLQIEKAKKRSITGVMNGFAKMIHAYEKNQFDAKYYYKTCPDCSYFNICDVAQSESFLWI